MATMNRARLLLIRSSIIILAFFGIAFLWLVFDAILPQNHLASVLLGAWSIALFFLFWDFSLQLDQPGGSLDRASKDNWVFDSATADLEADQQDASLWTRVFAGANGAEARREAIYIRLLAKRQNGAASSKDSKRTLVSH
jgi:hypothetical protein